MRIESIHLATPLVTGAVAVAVAVAPAVATAANPAGTCTSVGASATECRAPGNVQIDDAPPAQDLKQYPYPDGFGISHHAIGQ
ncbi:MAG TPA: hypothetical protein VHT50_18600 [Mycobacterium sp.]|jgi:hypothetical protein|nr:hypothetical protein [Mycobacterium sp.]